MTPVQMSEDCFDRERDLSCLAGLYVLTSQGSIARLDAEGIPVMEPCLTARLSSGIDTFLDQFRAGEARESCLGAIVNAEAGTTGKLVFTDGLLNDLFDAGRQSGMPLTMYERRNKAKSVFQGMELLLNKKRSTEPYFPYFCPILFTPESDQDTLADRYGIDPDTATEVLYEVLDLSAPFLSSHCPPEALFEIRADMRRSQAGAAPEDNTGSSGALTTTGNQDSMPPLRAVSDTFFKEGDAMTGWLLEWFSPFNELTETQREIIAGYETIRKAATGTRLIERGSTADHCIYLVEGTLELVTEEGEAIRVSGGTRRSRLPISILTPHVYDVTAVTDVSVVVFSQKLVRKINEITRTYTGINRARSPEDSTAAISNGAQSVYFRHADV